MLLKKKKINRIISNVKDND